MDQFFLQHFHLKVFKNWRYLDESMSLKGNSIEGDFYMWPFLQFPQPALPPRGSTEPTMNHVRSNVTQILKKPSCVLFSQHNQLQRSDSSHYFPKWYVFLNSYNNISLLKSPLGSALPPCFLVLSGTAGSALPSNRAFPSMLLGQMLLCNVAAVCRMPSPAWLLPALQHDPQPPDKSSRCPAQEWEPLPPQPAPTSGNNKAFCFKGSYLTVQDELEEKHSSLPCTGASQVIKIYHWV